MNGGLSMHTTQVHELNEPYSKRLLTLLILVHVYSFICTHALWGSMHTCHASTPPSELTSSCPIVIDIHKILLRNILPFLYNVLPCFTSFAHGNEHALPSITSSDNYNPFSTINLISSLLHPMSDSARCKIRVLSLPHPMYMLGIYIAGRKKWWCPLAILHSYMYTLQ